MNNSTQVVFLVDFLALEGCPVSIRIYHPLPVASCQFNHNFRPFTGGFVTINKNCLG